MCGLGLDWLVWWVWRVWLVGWLVGFSATAESFGVLAQIGSRVVRGGPEVRFHEGSTRFCEGCGVMRTQKRAPHAVGDVT